MSDNDDTVASRANTDRFMGFGELLRQAEQVQVQASGSLNGVVVAPRLQTNLHAI